MAEKKALDKKKEDSVLSLDNFLAIGTASLTKLADALGGTQRQTIKEAKEKAGDREADDSGFLGSKKKNK